VIHEFEQARLKKQVEEISRDIAQWVRETRETREIGLYTSPANKEEIEKLIHSLDRGIKLWVNEEGTILIPQ
jgi:hypothetical protein